MNIGSRRLVRMLVALLAMVPAAGSTASKPTEDGLPRAMFTIADPVVGGMPNGPLFQRVKAALAAANAGDGTGFRQFLAPNTDLQLDSFASGKLQRSPFTVETIRAAIASCLGPYSFDEGTSWVQLSWVCRVDKDAPLARFVSFRDSPELSLTVWLEKGLIKTIVAVEPLPLPGRRAISMNAYEVMKGTH